MEKLTAVLLTVEKLTPVLRTAVLALVVLILIPIVIHLWCGVFDISRGYLVDVGVN